MEHVRFDLCLWYYCFHGRTPLGYEGILGEVSRRHARAQRTWCSKTILSYRKSRLTPVIHCIFVNLTRCEAMAQMFKMFILQVFSIALSLFQNFLVCMNWRIAFDMCLLVEVHFSLDSFYWELWNKREERIIILKNVFGSPLYSNIEYFVVSRNVQNVYD